jgi:hypothetical protein
MQDFFDALSGPNGKNVAIVCIFFLGVCLAGIIAFTQWRKSEVRRLEAAIKLEMLQRGMSAGEIVQVLQAGHSRCGHSFDQSVSTTTTNAPQIG